MITLSEVSKQYTKNSTGLNDVSLHVDAGEFVCVVGQSGTGKTTLIKLLIAEEQPTGGKVEIGGWDITRIKQRDIPLLRRQIGVIFQDYKLLEKKSVIENIAFALQVSGATHKRIQDTVPRVLDIVGLTEKKYAFPHQLSGGQKQRVAIARALVHRPKILVADEPTGNLDAINANEIIEIIKKINAFGTTIILVTHDRGIVNRLRKRVITLHDGSVVLDNTHGKYQL
ncbi:MAG: cell division ATP-binding protein FtsE [Candidatus Magasanikbacteria bacterium]|jgi:cell division transport system ATP-binding protein|nr:cell division ATP-binding protein FtsE [Candidatus Magasanikbacteria bacterium]MBT5262378.1 cell division ATP-binding protein FtsE [Candidatus Magasanikbacteria bacterium]MBT6294287.1 cell division ATP-binding protein FtsE [Candidatus Magasanikbacteria bacterium]